MLQFLSTENSENSQTSNQQDWRQRNKAHVAGGSSGLRIDPLDQQNTLVEKWGADIKLRKIRRRNVVRGSGNSLIILCPRSAQNRKRLSAAGFRWHFTFYDDVT